MGTSRRETWLAKHDLWLYCSCSIQLPEQMRPVWPHGVAVDICPLHQPLSRNSWTVIQLWLHLTKTPLRKKQDWELNCYQSWGKAPHSNKVVMFQELENILSFASWQFELIPHYACTLSDHGNPTTRDKSAGKLVCSPRGMAQKPCRNLWE